MLLNSKNFNFQFFLSDNKQVNSLEAGAKENGGATKYNNGIYSNIPGSEYMTINESYNKLSVFIPDTISVNNTIDNKYYIREVQNMIKNLYNNSMITYYKTEGSWYSEDLNKVVYDNITIMSIELSTITEADINNFINIATWIKIEMQQEGVSININNSLAII